MTLDLEACVVVLAEGSMGLILPFSFTPTPNTNRNHQAHFTFPESRFSPEIQTGEDGMCLTLRKSAETAGHTRETSTVAAFAKTGSPNHWPLQVVYYRFRHRRKQPSITHSQITSFKKDYCSQPRPQRMCPLLEVQIIAFLRSLARLKIMRYRASWQTKIQNQNFNLNFPTFNAIMTIYDIIK